MTEYERREQLKQEKLETFVFSLLLGVGLAGILCWWLA